MTGVRGSLIPSPLWAFLEPLLTPETEYPGEPDIPGLPAGGPDDGKNYLAFLKLVKSKLPAGKTLSIAAPASFWYLKQFPIKQISEVVDYIVYMTYDLHGQWDAGSKHAKYVAASCPRV